jgi:hypothetical protein
LSKDALKLSDILLQPELGPLATLLGKTTLLLEALPPDLQKKYGAAVNHGNPRGRYSFALELVKLTRIYCPAMGINIANPDNLPDEDSSFAVQSVEGLQIGAVIKSNIRFQRVNGAVTMICAESKPLTLHPGEQVTIGRDDFSACEMFGIKQKGGEKLVRTCDFKVQNQGVSRAAIVVSLDVTGQFLTILDCGSVNDIIVFEQGRRAMYDPEQNLTVFKKV